MERFRTDNTEGYSADQLAELNRIHKARVAAMPDEAQADKSICDYVAEHVLAEFDVA